MHICSWNTKICFLDIFEKALVAWQVFQKYFMNSITKSHQTFTKKVVYAQNLLLTYFLISKYKLEKHTWNNTAYQNNKIFSK